MLLRAKKLDTLVSIPREALEAIFDECDGFEADETGGRIIGHYRRKGNKYEIDVTGIIGPGPNAQRTATSFFQDGEYQERVFRSIEEQDPNVEHLGNWHTHHVNGLATLSSGDKTTYQRIVNHDKHNTDFFYAILIVEKTPGGRQRYKAKHYVLYRNDPRIYEIPDSKIQVVDKPIVWPRSREKSGPVTVRSGASPTKAATSDGHQERVKDQEFFDEFYPHLKPQFSRAIGALYWRGKLGLVDDRLLDVLAMENQDQNSAFYTITITGEHSQSYEVTTKYKDKRFKSARQAVVQLERDINREIFLRRG